ncbi:hypothetical protein VTK73DRAFT_1160 [Phialemonium thermophilum]|uniref:SHSP domain-containing protein n=1 Tax=Phialemonium thermophilum TaxID=223376 RepID=A0ABR3VTS9_9PEZI
MSAYFTTHHFSPRWSAAPPSHGEQHPRQQHVPFVTTITAPTILPPSTSLNPHATITVPSQAPPDGAHLHANLDLLARFLHAFHLHYNNQDGGGGESKAGETQGQPQQRQNAHPLLQHHHHGGGSDGGVYPHFDLAETESAYTIYGALPGLGSGDVTVEVSDDHSTVVVSGELRRTVAEGPGAHLEDIGVVHRQASAEGSKSQDDAAPSSDDPGAAAGSSTGGEGAPTQPGTATGSAKDQDASAVHWHVLERRVGPFQRAFQFPANQVDTNGVKASMRNGVLVLVVPKTSQAATAVKGRKINVS